MLPVPLSIALNRHARTCRDKRITWPWESTVSRQRLRWTLAAVPRASQYPLLLLLLLPLQGAWLGRRHPKPETRHHWREQDRSTQHHVSHPQGAPKGWSRQGLVRALPITPSTKRGPKRDARQRCDLAARLQRVPQILPAGMLLQLLLSGRLPKATRVCANQCPSSCQRLHTPDKCRGAAQEFCERSLRHP